MLTLQSCRLRALFALLPIFGTAIEIIQTPAGNDLSLGNNFTLCWQANYFEILQGNTSIWFTVPGKPFVGASAGQDIVTGSGGAVNITNVDENECKTQNVLSFQYVDWEGTVTGTAVQVRGQVLNCGESSAPYSLTFWISKDLQDQVSFRLDIDAPPSLGLKKLYFKWASHANEDFYGFGAQASFASLKNRSVPIFSREQGTGRGGQPLAGPPDPLGGFAGGDEFTSYTGIASYVTTDGRAFYLTEKSTAYANFNLTQPNAVTLRYHSLNVDGGFARGKNMSQALEKLTAATGRMSTLPDWINEGTILGVQGS